MADKFDAFLDSDDDEIDAFLDDSDQRVPAGRPGIAGLISAIAASGPGAAIPGASALAIPAVRKAASEFARGTAAGLRRTGEPPQTIPGQVGGFLGRQGPAIAGSIAAGAALGGPVGAGAGLLRGVAAPLAAEAAGAGLGELAGQIGARAAGGPPVSIQEAAGAGLGAGAGAAAFRVPAAIAAKAIPTVAQVFTRQGAESIKRGIETPGIIPSVSKSLNAIEEEGISILRNIQRKAEVARKRLGTKVKASVNRLHMRTKGAPVVDISKAADAAVEILQDALSNPVTGPTVAKSEVRTILGVISRSRATPFQSVKQAVGTRRAIDDLAKFKQGAVQKVQSAVGQRALKAYAAKIREALESAAEAVGDDTFIANNRAFSEFADTFDERLVPLIGTKSLSPLVLRRKFRSLAGLLNEGGVSTREVDAIGEMIPGAAREAKRLSESLAGTVFTGLPIPTVSGALLNVIRLLGAPRVLGAGIKGTAPLRPFAPRAGAALGISAASSTREAKEKPEAFQP